MSESIKIRAVWASIAIACITVMIGGGSLLLNARALAAVPERVTHVEEAAKILRERMDALERELQTGRKERLTFQGETMSALSRIEAQQQAQTKILDRLERKMP